MLNRVILIGRLTRDPELRYTPQGTAVTNFGIAVSRRRNAQGESQADFFNVVCWQRVAETVAQYLTKGRLVAVEGRLQSRSYEQDGRRRTAIEVVASSVNFLDFGDQTNRAMGSDNPASGYSRGPAQQNRPSKSQNPNASYDKDMNFDDEDDDLPF